MKQGDGEHLPIIMAGKRLRVGGITYYMRDGQLMACASRRGKRTRRSAAERAAAERFAEVQRLWKVWRRATGDLPVWRVAAREAGAHRGNALFTKLNAGCVRAGEGVWAFDGFRFATGSMDVPLLRGARREGVWVTLEWERGEDAGGARWSDRVYVGFFSGTDARSPGMAACGEAVRGDGRAVAVLPLEAGEEDAEAHLYLFFGAADGSRFSPSVYVRL